MDTHRAMIVNKMDNVATALSDLTAGDSITLIGIKNLESIKANQSVPFGHKIALITIEEGETIIKYGEVIGRATQRIPQGNHVHIHNVESLRGRGDIHE